LTSSSAGTEGIVEDLLTTVIGSSYEGTWRPEWSKLTPSAVVSTKLLSLEEASAISDDAPLEQTAPTVI
jgi:hypothetical protein